jgi:hypothetical protein
LDVGLKDDDGRDILLDEYQDALLVKLFRATEEATEEFDRRARKIRRFMTTLLVKGFDIFPATKWNKELDDPVLREKLRKKTRKEIEQTRRAESEREFMERWRGVTARLPEEQYDRERMEWRPIVPQLERPRQVVEEEEIAHAMGLRPADLEQVRAEQEIIARQLDRGGEAEEEE